MQRTRCSNCRGSISAGLAFAASVTLCGFALGENLPDKHTAVIFEPALSPRAETNKTWFGDLRQYLTAKTRLFGNLGIQQVIDENASWPSISGQPTVITVAFNGGDASLHRKVADVAQLWCASANVRLDFGWNQQTGQFRAWTTHDPQRRPAANIRIGFFAGEGYRSEIGREAETRVEGNKATMNLEGFDRALPDNWQWVVLHEFGHAFALRHEVQHPGQRCDLRWNDEPGYSYYVSDYGTAIPDRQGKHPGVYTVFGSAPNHWTREQVDDNLRIITDVRGSKVSDFDRDSVMLYPMPSWLFESAASPCSSGEKTALSTRDKAAIAYQYPKDARGLARKEADKRALTIKLQEMRSEGNSGKR